jgi:hypothetical protein
MINHYCYWTCDARRTLDFAVNLLTSVWRGQSVMEVKGQIETAKLAVQKAITQGNGLGWQLTDRIKAEQLLRELNTGNPISAEALVRELSGIRTSFDVALQIAKFVYVPSIDDKYFEVERLFGDDVFEVFEDAREDVTEAGNCLALALYTASVFHLMRVSEFGLRRLAAKLRVKLFDKGKPQQVEDATWDKVIDGVHLKIKATRQLSAGPKKRAQLTRFSEAGDHCTFMKDIWRNNVSHTRKPYIRDEALAAFSRVGDFMKFIALDMKEAK